MHKSGVALAIAIVAFSLRAGAQISYVPPAGFVPDEKTAIRIAKAVLSAVYGEARIEAQEPFVAGLKDGIWTIEGHLPRGLAGGVALVEISQLDARIIRMNHGK